MSKYVIQIAKGRGELSKSQKEFNGLIAKIENSEREIQALRQSVERIQKRVVTDLVPLHSQYNEQRAALVKRYDRAHNADFFNKVEKRKLAALIVEMAFHLIGEAGMEDLKSIYDKYDHDGYETTRAEAELETIRNGMEAVENEWNDPPEVGDRQNSKQHWNEKTAGQANKSKTAKQREREEKKELTAKNVSKAVRTVYMDLVKAFHPDREPDEDQKIRKTEIMHRVTEAYENNDLLKLLRLQLEFERIEQTHFEMLAEEQLRYYNKILKQQANALASESSGLLLQIRTLLGNPGYDSQLSLSTIDSLFDRDIRSLKNTIKALRHNLKAFEDNSNLKAFLKEYRI